MTLRKQPTRRVIKGVAALLYFRKDKVLAKKRFKNDIRGVREEGLECPSLVTWAPDQLMEHQAGWTSPGMPCQVPELTRLHVVPS